jgi:hypothetical protein
VGGRRRRGRRGSILRPGIALYMVGSVGVFPGWRIRRNEEEEEVILLLYCKNHKHTTRETTNDLYLSSSANQLPTYPYPGVETSSNPTYSHTHT